MLAIVSLSFLGLMGSAGLAIDVGYWYWQRVLLQVAADAGALAGAQDIENQNLTGNYVYNDTKARQYIGHNGVNKTTEVDSIVYTPPSGSNAPRVTVILKRDVGTFFLAVFGARTVPIRARAVAEAVDAVSGFTGTTGANTAIDYAVFSGDPTSQFKITGGGKRINGDAHGNGTIEAKQGNDQRINGDLSAVGVIDRDPSKVALTGTQTAGAPTVSDDIIPLALIQQYADYKYLSGFDIDAQIPDGVYYVEGDLHINFNIQGHVSFVVTGDIHLNGHLGTINANNNAIGLVSLATDKKNGIHINAKDAVINAFLLAPYGGIHGSGNGWTVNGGVAGDDVDISGNDITINYGLAHAQAIPTTPAYSDHVHLIE